MTNFERITGSQEALAERLDDMGFCPHEDEPCPPWTKKLGVRCGDCIVAWLNQPAEGEE